MKITEDDLGVLGSFRNLKKLTIVGGQIDSELQDIVIADFPKLETIEVFATRRIRTINFKDIPNVWDVNISGNSSLQEIIGLEEIKGLMSLFAIDNKTLTKLFNVIDISNLQDIDKISLDISTLHLLAEQYPNIRDIASNPNMRKKVKWLEKVDKNWFRLGFDEGIEIETIASQILSQIVNDSMSDTEKICAINTWLIENVTYDMEINDERDAVISGERELSYLAKRMDARANTSYNALSKRKAVCEGYTNAMKYLLNKVGIEAETVPCRIWGKDESRTPYVSREDANHSIIRFRTKEGWFYSDVTFDSEDSSRRQYFFKTKKEMSAIHGLAKSEMEVDSPDIRPARYSNELLSEILTNQRNKNNQEEYKEQVETKSRPNQSPESFRESLRWTLTENTIDEITDIRKEIESGEVKQKTDNPEKPEAPEYGVK